VAAAQAGPHPAAAAAAAVAAPVATDPALLALMRAQLAPIASPVAFRGASSGLEAQRWINAMEQFFVVALISDNATRLARAGALLQGPAMLWWQGEVRRLANDANKISTWTQFSAALLKRYQPVDTQQWARQQLQSLTARKSLQVTSYTDRFLEIVSLLPAMDEGDRVFTYRLGLPSAARDALATKQFSTLEEITHKALVWEAARGPQSNPAPTSPSSSSRGPLMQARLNSVDSFDGESDERPADEANATILAQLSRMDARITQLAGNAGPRRGESQQRKGDNQRGPSRHQGRTPGLSDELAQARIKAQLCIHCGQKGHRKRDCTNPADVVTLPTN
jgi:Retrotransposon gag protein